MFIVLLAFLVILSGVSYAEDSAQYNYDNSDTSLARTEVIQSHAGAFQFPLTPEREKELESYSDFKNFWRFFRFAVGLAILSIILFTGLSARIRDYATRLYPSRAMIYAVYLFLYTAIVFLITLPFDYYRGFVMTHKYGLSKQTLIDWLSDQILSDAIYMVIMYAVILILYSLIQKTKKWWLYVGLCTLPFMIIIMLVYPTIITPIFNEFEPIQDEPLRSSMTELAQKAGIENPEILRVNTSERSNYVNAYFVGIFGTKRIVLYDNMIDNFTLDEMRYSVAHEMGHYKLNHIWIGIIGFTLMVLIGAYMGSKVLPSIISRFRTKLRFDRLDDIAGYPLILLYISIFSFMTQPVWNYVSRQMEYACDRYGMELSEISGTVAQSSFEKLSAFNLSDPDPSPIIEFWFYSHPSLKNRIDHAYRVREELNN